MQANAIMDKISLVLKRDFQTTLEEATPQELHNALATVVMGGIADSWYTSRHAHEHARSAFYFSAEFLTAVRNSSPAAAYTTTCSRSAFSTK